VNANYEPNVSNSAEPNRYPLQARATGG